MVSIVMCCYNGSRFMQRSFNSILSQTYDKIELLFVDDGSTDDSAECAESFRCRFTEKGYELHIFSQKNKGVGFATQLGIKNAKGKYLTLLDVDDFLMPESIALKADYLDSHPNCYIVRSNGYEVFERNLEDTSRLLVVKEREKTTDNLFLDLLYGKTNNWAGTYMVRLDVLRVFYKDREMYGSRYGQNLQIMLPLAYLGQAGFIDVPLMKYIRNDHSHTMSNNSLKRLLDLQRGYLNIRMKMLDTIGVADNVLRKKVKVHFLKKNLELCLLYRDAGQYNHLFYELIDLDQHAIGLKEKFEHAYINKQSSAFLYRVLFYLQRKF